MSRLRTEDYLEHLRTESARFRDVIARSDPATRVPACPDWDLGDLLWHLAHVQWWWSEIVAGRPAGPEALESPERPETLEDTLAFFDRASAALVAVLVDADPAEHAWTWAPEQTVGFTVRRQAHEALIHRLDAEQAVVQVSALDPRLAADGVEEAIAVMYGGVPPWGTFTPDGRTVLLETTDTDDQVLVALGRFTGTDPADAESRARDEPDLDLAGPEHADREPDAVIQGSAGDLDAWLWHRGEEDVLDVQGDEESLSHLRGILAQPLT